MNDLGLIPLPAEVAVTPVACRTSGLMYVSSADHRFFREAMESLFAQTVSLEQLVLVVAGKLTDEQERILVLYQTDPRIRSMDIVRKASLAEGLNAGLALCSGDWILRVDGDTISHPDRLAILLDYVDRYPEVTVFASWCEEFDQKIRRIKVSSVQHDAVVNALRWRNALVPSSTLLHTETLRMIGGYRSDFTMLAEYDLHVRLALAGAIFRVVPAELIAQPVRPRSGGFRFVREEIRFRLACWRRGFVNAHQCLTITLCQNVFNLVGVWMRSRLYRLVRSYPAETYTRSCVIERPSRETLGVEETLRVKETLGV